MSVEKIARAGEAGGKFRTLASIAAPEPTRAVAEAIVPFSKAGRMVAELVPARPDIPGFGDQLDAGQDWILAQGVEKARAGIEAIGLAAERDAEIETEAVDMERCHPIAQRVDDQSAARADATG